MRVRDVAVDRLVNSVAAGDVELAVGSDRPIGDDVARTTLLDSAWVLWCSPKHRLARRRTMRWANLRDQPLVAAGCDHERGVAQMRLSVLEKSRVTPVDVVDNITTALGIAAQGTTATLAPAYVAVVAQSLGLVMRRVLDPETVRKVCICRSAVRNLSPAAEAFAEHLTAWLPGWAIRSGANRPPETGSERKGRSSVR